MCVAEKEAGKHLTKETGTREGLHYAKGKIKRTCWQTRHGLKIDELVILMWFDCLRLTRKQAGLRVVRDVVKTSVVCTRRAASALLRQAVKCL